MKILKIIKNVATVFLTVIILIFAASICLQRFSNNNFSFLDYRMFSVVTGSMAPKYNIGDVLICKKTNPADLKIGDDITYLGKYGSYSDRVVTHRIIKTEKKDNGKYQFYTKGIASLVEDPVVEEDQVYGKIVMKVQSLSYFYKLISKGSGFYLFIIFPIMFIIGSEIISTMVEKYEKRRNNN